MNTPQTGSPFSSTLKAGIALFLAVIAALVFFWTTASYPQYYDEYWKLFGAQNGYRFQQGWIKSLNENNMRTAGSPDYEAAAEQAKSDVAKIRSAIYEKWNQANSAIHCRCGEMAAREFVSYQVPVPPCAVDCRFDINCRRRCLAIRFENTSQANDQTGTVSLRYNRRDFHFHFTAGTDFDTARHPRIAPPLKGIDCGRYYFSRPFVFIIFICLLVSATSQHRRQSNSLPGLRCSRTGITFVCCQCLIRLVYESYIKRRTRPILLLQAGTSNTRFRPRLYNLRS